MSQDQSKPHDRGESRSGSIVIVEVTCGPLAGQEFHFNDHQTLTIGRSQDSGLSLPDDPRISRFHCQLRVNPPTCSIVDLSSRNGTLVDGQRVEHASLGDGSKVTLGGTELVIRIKLGDWARNSDAQTTLLVNRIHETHADRDAFPEIAGYEIIKLLGEGGMGAVYSAKRRSNGAKVAIKVIRPEMTMDQAILDRFCREAAIILRLQHPRIVQAFDFQFTQARFPALITEFIDEVNLNTVFRNQSIERRSRLAASIMVRVLEGLDYAHRLEIVHRDVKPSNILAYKSGRKLQVKLADFGLAKNYVDASFTDCSTSNQTAGTLAYMPPEQIIDCRRAKPSCDIYAAGVCLYQMISKRLPYKGDSVASQISLILNGEPVPIARYVPTLDPVICDIISKAMDRDPEKRFATASEMRDKLAPIAHHRS